MERIKVEEMNAVEKAVQVLRNDGVIAAPTETVYGLMAAWRSESGREAIYRLKHRPANKKMQMLLGSLDELLAFGLKNPDWIEAIGRQFWPGPLTLIVETESGETIGARIPRQEFVLKALQRLGAPLAATSANLSGEPPASTADDAVARLDGTPELLVDGGVVTVTGGQASTVASIVGRKLTILRQGVVSLEDLEACISECN